MKRVGSQRVSSPTWTEQDQDLGLFHRHATGSAPHFAAQASALGLGLLTPETATEYFCGSIGTEREGCSGTDSNRHCGRSTSDEECRGSLGSRDREEQDGPRQQGESKTSCLRGDMTTDSGTAEAAVALGGESAVAGEASSTASRAEHAGATPGEGGASDSDVSNPRQGESDGRTAAEDKRSSLLFDVGPDKQPVVYSPGYNVTFMGMEKLHPFDSTKWQRVLKALVKDGRIAASQVVAPQPATQDDLLTVHTREYLDSLKSSLNVAGIAELPFVALIPNSLVQRHLLQPFRFQVGGSVLAAKLAIERGWAFNIGGGFHHACSFQGGGFCAYADITILIKFARQHLGIQRVMIIDLDAHQGNGHERDFMNLNGDTYIFDVYNRDIYPKDHKAKAAISLKVELRSGTGTEEYISRLEDNMQVAFQRFSPQLVVYNAGTDVLDGDPLGCLRVSAQGVIERDQIVFAACRERGVPIVMLTSGGYQQNNAQIIADSVGNLADKGLVTLNKKEVAEQVENAVRAKV